MLIQHIEKLAPIMLSVDYASKFTFIPTTPVIPVPLPESSPKPPSIIHPDAIKTTRPKSPPPRIPAPRKKSLQESTRESTKVISEPTNAHVTTNRYVNEKTRVPTDANVEQCYHPSINDSLFWSVETFMHNLDKNSEPNILQRKMHIVNAMNARVKPYKEYESRITSVDYGQWLSEIGGGERIPLHCLTLISIHYKRRIVVFDDTRYSMFGEQYADDENPDRETIWIQRIRRGCFHLARTAPNLSEKWKMANYEKSLGAVGNYKVSDLVQIMEHFREPLEVDGKKLKKNEMYELLVRKYSW